MILIADSGSTTCDWVLCKPNGEIIRSYSTKGINPNFISKQEILQILEKSNLDTIKKNINRLYFYGAGCSNEQNKKKIHYIFKDFFLKTNIHIKHDLEAAACAAYDNQSCIVCILGTGSNTCFYDGNSIKENTPSLGFILGDEGSGNYFGKKLLQSFFYQNLPDNIRGDFLKTFKNELDNIILNIYNNKQPNTYIASFFPFILKHKNDKFIKKMLLEGLTVFFDKHIKVYKNYNSVPINFVGSVAFFLKEEINHIGEKFNCNINSFIKSPINRLAQHITSINEEDTKFL